MLEYSVQSAALCFSILCLCGFVPLLCCVSFRASVSNGFSVCAVSVFVCIPIFLLLGIIVDLDWVGVK